MCNRKEWIVLVPPPFEGHFTPMLHLGSLLHSKGFSILVAHPEFQSSKPPPHPHPDFAFLSLPYSTLSISCRDLLSTIAAMNRDCREPLVSSLVNRTVQNEDIIPGGRIICIIYDWVMNFGEAVATELKLPSLIFRTCSAAYTKAYHAVSDLQAENRLPLSVCQQQDPVPGYYPLRFKDLPVDVFSEMPDIGQQFIVSTMNLRSSVAIIWNTADDLEHTELKQYQQRCNVPFFTLGPMYKMAAAESAEKAKVLEKEKDTDCIEWLDKQAHESVIYISLGTLSTIDKQEFEEIANGLLKSGQPFLWVIRPSSVHGSDWVEALPGGFRELVGERGQIVKWAPQKEVLAHPAVGGFLSHCGWNSMLESICEAVPMICRPCFGDQLANARYITQVWKVGLELEDVNDTRAIESTIRRLMVDNQGKEIRRRVLRLKMKLEASVGRNGSSYRSLNDLTNFIRSY